MSKKLIVVINGRGASGKDTCIGFIPRDKYKIMNTSSIDPIKEAAGVLGWNGVKTKEARKFLSDMKKLSVSFNDFPVKYITMMYNEFLSSDNDIMFIHVREPKEIEKIVNTIPNVVTLLVKRDLIGELGNDADDNVEDYNYDIIFENNGTKQEAEINFNKLIDSIYNGSVTSTETNL